MQQYSARDSSKDEDGAAPPSASEVPVETLHDGAKPRDADLELPAHGDDAPQAG